MSAPVYRGPAEARLDREFESISTNGSAKIKIIGNDKSIPLGERTYEISVWGWTFHIIPPPTYPYGSSQIKYKKPDSSSWKIYEFDIYCPSLTLEAMAISVIVKLQESDD